MAEILTKVVTGKVRFSYINLLAPKEPEKAGDVPKYGASLMIPKSDKVTIQKIKAAIDAVKNDPKAQKIWGGKWHNELKYPLRDGDNRAEKHPEYAGHLFVNVTSTTKPKIVDRDVNPILDPTEIYSGMYGRASLNFYAFNKKGGIGIAVSLLNVQKLEDGEPLGGVRSTPEQDFDDSYSDEDPLS